MVKIITENAPKGKKRSGGRTDAQVEAQAELDAAREGDTARRQDTRRKVVIGGALMALAERDDDAAKLLTRIKRSLTRPADKKLFAKEPSNG